MLTIKSFTFFPEYFGENTYVLSDESKQCVVIDPGCYHLHEKQQLLKYIESQGLELKMVLLTHCHIDHIMGNAFLLGKFDVPLVAHRDDLYNLEGAETFARMYSLSFEPSPQPTQFVEEGDVIRFGNTELEVLFTPGHSKGHVSFFHRAGKQVFSGDVLFRNSIGRIDLPGGSGPVLLRSILEKLFPLGDDVEVYAGHMEPTTIGYERQYNQLVKQMQQAFS